MANLPLVAAINDMSGFGRCSLTVAIPVLSAMGLQCCPLPTALLSNHTGYESFFFSDYTDSMEAYYREWLKLDLDFDAIYSGFLGSEKQVKIVTDIIKVFKHKQQAKGVRLPFVLVDPVMGDNGAVYTTYTKELCEAMKELVTCADIITPNLTEACILLDREYTSEYLKPELAMEMARALTEQGPEIAVITGVKTDCCTVLNLAYERPTDRFAQTEYSLVKPHYNGTGDVFASVLCGALVNGLSIDEALTTAAEFVFKAAQYTSAQGGNTPDGVMIEHFLHELWQPIAAAQK